MGVHVDRPRQDEQPVGIEGLGRRGRQSGQIAFDRLDPAVSHGDVRSPRPGGRNDRSAADQQVRPDRLDAHRLSIATPFATAPQAGRAGRVPQATSRIVIGCAPSQRQRRPTSRSRSCQPWSGSIVAKWLAASWPTFEDVAQAP